MSTEFTTPPAVFVSGNLFEPYPDGKYFFAVAIKKTDPKYDVIWNAIKSEAIKGFPKLFNPQGKCIARQFAFKVIDGDSEIPNTKGVAPREKAGYRGHWVINFGGMFPPKVFNKKGTEVLTQVGDIKRGDIIKVAGSVKANGSSVQPGVYLNAKFVALVEHGTPLETTNAGTPPADFFSDAYEGFGEEDVPF